MITLTTDFGVSEYMGAMKGVIYSINPGAVIVDLTHSIRPFDIRRGAYAIYSTFPFFPKKTVHMAVVDPGVGTERKGLILEGAGHFFIGPDNGVFSLIDADRIYEIELEGKSATFHGRDVFAPVATKIDAGQPPSELGREIEGFKRIMNKEVIVSETMRGEVYCTDGFGNIITSIKREHMQKGGYKIGDEIEIKLGAGEMVVPFVRSYGDLKKGCVGLLLNSFDHLEIALREGNAADKLGIAGGEAVEMFI